MVINTSSEDQLQQVFKHHPYWLIKWPKATWAIELQHPFTYIIKESDELDVGLKMWVSTVVQAVGFYPNGVDQYGLSDVKLYPGGYCDLIQLTKSQMECFSNLTRLQKDS